MADVEYRADGGTVALEPRVQNGALGLRSRFLPDQPARSGVIGTAEPVAEALRRITTEQFSTAIDALCDPDTEIGAAAAIAIGSLGRIGGIVRLVRSSIGPEVCRDELRMLHDSAALLDGVDAGADAIRSLDRIVARYEPTLRPGALSDLRDQLLHRHQLARIELVPTLRHDGALEQVIRRLRRARARFAAWPVEEQERDRRPVPDTFDAFADGLERTYRKGRKRAAEDEPDRSAWHRHVRDLGHQVELLSGAWPGAMSATVATARDLAEVLDEHRRMGALGEALGDASLHVEDPTRAIVEAVCAHERAELTAIASVLAARLYAERPADFVARLGRYWTTRATVTGGSQN